MGGQRTTFGKLQRERAKKAKAAAKRERRQERGTAVELDEDAAAAAIVAADEGGELSAAELLKLIEAIHQNFDAGTLTLEQFEEKKTELLQRLPVD